MQKDYNRKASADFHAKRKAAGWRKVTVWLDPGAAAKVDAMKAAAGSADEVHRKAIMAWKGPCDPPSQRKALPEKPPKAATIGLQVGPITPAAGSRLKGSKK